MYTQKRLYSILLLGLVLMLAFVWSSAGFAQDGGAQGGDAHIRMVQTFEPDQTGLSHPVGLAYSAKSNTFQVVETRGGGQSPPAETDVIRLTPFSERAGSAQIAAQVGDPINMVFDNRADRLLMLESPAGGLIGIAQEQGGDLDPQTLKRQDAQQLRLREPRGVAVDPTSGNLFILDAVGPRIVRVEAGAEGGFAEAVIAPVDLRGSGLAEARGLAFDPSTGHLHLMSVAEQQLVEVTPDGQVVAVRDLSGFGLGDPQGMVFAPSGDQTDEPSQVSLYVADRGTGDIVEFSLAAPVAPVAISFQSVLVSIVDMGVLSPPSPDPAGVTYRPASETLVVTDPEVEETVKGVTHFAGVNVWEMTLSGSVVRTANISLLAPTVVPMTNEPAGIAWNPSNGHYFVSDDGGSEIYDLNPGGDGLIGTADDSWTHFDTLVHGNSDPEGITVDTASGHLFVADGVNQEVYEYTLAGDLVSHFDVNAYGVGDPESVEYNPVDNTLYVMSSNLATPVIAEFTTGGVFLQAIDISASNALQAAGLAYAPASDGSGAKRFYIVDRGVDNNANQNAVDGKLYEMTTPPGSNSPPVATDDSASTAEENAVTIDAAANDSDPDGDLDTTSANTACPACTIPADGTLVNNGNGTFTYTPDLNFSGSDGFVYQICDTKDACDTATVSITVTPSPDPPTAVEDSAGTVEDTSVTVYVAANDVDPDGDLDPASASSITTPTNGTLVNNGDGTFTYTPDLNFTGPDGFDYEICDSQPVCDTATVTIAVSINNDPPTANDDSASTPEDTPVTIDVAANDSDPDGDLDPASASSIKTPVNGGLVNNGDGTFTYTPDLNFTGSDGFTYQICDTQNACDTASVSISVAPSPDPPAAVDDSASTAEDTAVTINVAANDSDPDGNLDPASANTTCPTCTNPDSGSLVNNGNGAFRYRPEQNFSGSDGFVYEICDSLGACDTAAVIITVAPVADPPVAKDDSASTPRNTPVTINVAANDSDPDGNLDPASASPTTTPANGSLVNNGDGTFTYTPDQNFTGSDGFVYQICDTKDACDTAAVSITVNASTSYLFLPLALNGTPGGVAARDVDTLP